VPCGRKGLPVGWGIGTSAPVGVPARGANALVRGLLSGKSSFVGGLVERLAGAHDAVCVIDPEGDYHVLSPRRWAATEMSDRVTD
jgi:hypothetical protein